MGERAVAGEGEIYVCRACGRTAKNPYDFTDAACFVNSILCVEKSIIRNEDGQVIKADAIKDAD